MILVPLLSACSLNTPPMGRPDPDPVGRQGLVVRFVDPSGREVSADQVVPDACVSREVDPIAPAAAGQQPRLRGLWAPPWTTRGNELAIQVAAERVGAAFWAPGTGGAERIYVVASALESGSAEMTATVSSAKLRGKVVDRAGAPVQGVCVALLPASRGRTEAQGIWYASWAAVETGADGTFAVDHLFAGSYQVAVGARYPFPGRSGPEGKLGGSSAGVFPELPDGPDESGLLVLEVPGLPVQLGAEDVVLRNFVVEPARSHLAIDVGAIATSGPLKLSLRDAPRHWILPPFPIGGAFAWRESTDLVLEGAVAEGIGRFGPLPRGRYDLFVPTPGPVTPVYTISVSATGDPSEPQRFRLTPLDAERQGGIEGRIEGWEDLPLALARNRLGSGDPAWLVEFMVLSSPLARGKEHGEVCTVGTTTIRSDGAFRVPGLLPGAYRVTVRCGFNPRVHMLASGGADSTFAALRERLAKLSFPELDVEVRPGTTQAIALRFR